MQLTPIYHVPKHLATFESFMARVKQFASPHYKTRLKSKYPCPNCDGYGKIHHDEDRDIIEGFKLAPWYICQKCGGIGDTTHKWYEDKYSRELIEHQRQHDASVQKQKLQIAFLESVIQHYPPMVLKAMDLPTSKEELQYVIDPVREKDSTN